MRTVHMQKAIDQLRAAQADFEAKKIGQAYGSMTSPGPGDLSHYCAIGAIAHRAGISNEAIDELEDIGIEAVLSAAGIKDHGIVSWGYPNKSCLSDMLAYLNDTERLTFGEIAHALEGMDAA